MTNYKQWAGNVRKSRYGEYKAARAAGKIPPPCDCEICGQSKGTMHHAEDYGPDLAAYFSSLHSLCGRCHAWLHLRFRFPGRWSEYKFKVRMRGRANPMPPVKGMSSVFYGARFWRDCPVISYEHNGEWWEHLTMENTA